MSDFETIDIHQVGGVTGGKGNFMDILNKISTGLGGAQSIVGGIGQIASLFQDDKGGDDGKRGA